MLTPTGLNRLLQKFVLRRRTMTLLVILYWYVFNLLPYLFAVEVCARQGPFCPMRYFSWLQWGTFVAVPVVIGLEFILVTTIFRLVKSAWLYCRPGVAQLLFFIPVAIVVLLFAIYLSTLAMSWYAYLHRGFFLTPSSVPLFHFLFDLETLLTATTTHDRVAIFGLLSIGVLSSLCWFLMAPVTLSRKSFLRCAMWEIFLGGFAIILLSLPRLEMTAEEYEKFKGVVLNSISPQLSLAWAPLLYGESNSGFQKVALKLHPIVENNEPYVAPSQAAKPQKNIILLMVEALRSDVISLAGGDPKITPHLNQLAVEGYFFQYAYTQSPETGGAMFTLVTGLYPLVSLVRDSHLTVDYPVTRVYDLLSSMGYRTAYLTWEWYVTHYITASNRLDLYVDPQSIPKEEIVSELPESFIQQNPIDAYFPVIGDKYNVQRARRWLEAHSNGNESLFLMMYFYSSHFTYQWPRSQEVVFEPWELQSTPSFLHYPKELAPVMQNRYFNSLHYIDSLIGELVESLRSTGRLENTIIIVTGDHGQLFHEHGAVTHTGLVHEEAIRVPLIIWGARDFYPYRNMTAPVSHVDIVPTILELTGEQPREDFQGQTILFRNHQDAEQAPIRPIFTVSQIATYEEAVIVWPWKYVKNYRGLPERLFNLQKDSKEQQNVLSNEPQVAAELAQRIQDFRNKQLTYYNFASPYKQRFYPPKHDR